MRTASISKQHTPYVTWHIIVFSAKLCYINF